MLKRIILPFVFLIFLAHANSANSLSSELFFHHIISLKQLQPILLHAKQHSQFVLIDFNEKKCAACVDLKSKTFNDIRVQTALKNYRLIEIYLTTHNMESFQKRFNVKSAPTLVFIDKGGQFLPEFSTTGFVTAEQLLGIVARIEKGNEN